MKRISYAPRRGKYRAQIDGKLQPGPENLLTQAQVLAQNIKLLEDGHSLRITRTNNTPKRRK